MIDQALAQRAFDAIVAMRQAPDPESLSDAVGPVLADIGLPWFTLARFFDSARTLDVRVLAGRFHPEWTARYVRENYAASSQIAQEMLRSSAPYSWCEVMRRRVATPQQRRILEEARGYGLEKGLVTPMRWIDGSYAAVILAGSKPDLESRTMRTTAELLSSYFASEARRLHMARRKPVLSPRQLECLQWVRLGKSSAAIASILGLSTETVEEYISAACRKLGVRTRVQAVIEAALSGMLD